MAYVLTNGAFSVVTYPYSIGMLRRDNPNVSFPANPSDAELASFNVFPVVPTPQPSYDVINENLVENDPLPVSVNWVQDWSVVPASAQEIADRTAAYEASAAAEAARLIAESDAYWTKAFEDGVGLHADFLAYRAALQDPSSLAGYPVAPAWPSFPTNIFNNAAALPIDVYTKSEVDGEVGSRLSVYGGTMQGELDMNGYRIPGVANAINATDATNKQYVDDAIAAATGGETTPYLPLAGGFMSGNIDMLIDNKIINMADPTEGTDAATKSYVDTAIAAIPPSVPRLTINLETDAGTNTTTATKIADALTTIGNTNGYTINLGFGEYREAGPVVVNNKSQLQIVGPASAGTTAVVIKNGLTVQNSNGVRMLRVQVEGATAIACRAGNGQYFERCQFMGAATISGTGGFMMFIDCDFGGNITIDPAFAGTVYFVRTTFSNATGVYTFGQTSALQAIIYEGNGIPNAGIAKASFSGVTTYKNGSQALFINGVPISNAGATTGQVLKFNGTAWAPAADSAEGASSWTLLGTQAGNSTNAINVPGGTLAAFKAANKEVLLITTDGAGAIIANMIVPTSEIATSTPTNIWNQIIAGSPLQSYSSAELGTGGGGNYTQFTLRGSVINGITYTAKAYYR